MREEVALKINLPESRVQVSQPEQLQYLEKWSIWINILGIKKMLFMRR